MTENKKAEKRANETSVSASDDKPSPEKKSKLDDGKSDVKEADGAEECVVSN